MNRTGWVVPNWVLLFIALLCQPSMLWADGCFFSKNRDMAEPNQRAVILFDQGVEDLIIQAQFSGAASDFGWIVPLPSKPEVTAVKAEIFPELREYTFARSKWEGYIDYSTRFGGRGGLGAMAGAPGADSVEGVDVLETRKVGVYEISVLQAEGADALVQWCQKNGYRVQESAKAVLNEYVAKGWFFVAMRIQSAEQSKGQEVALHSGTIQPVKFTFAADEAIYPLRISAINGSASDVLVYILANDTLIHPAFETRHGPNVEEFWHYRLEKAANGNSKKMEKFSAYFDDAHGSFRAIDAKELPLCREALPRMAKSRYFLNAQQRSFKPEDMTFDTVFQPIDHLNPESLDQFVQKNLDRGYRIDPLLFRITDRVLQLLIADFDFTAPKGVILAKNWGTRLPALVLLSSPGMQGLLDRAAKDGSADVRAVLEDSLLRLLVYPDAQFPAHDIAAKERRDSARHQSNLSSAGLTWNRFGGGRPLPYWRFMFRVRDVPGREAYLPVLRQLFAHCESDSLSAMALGALGTKESIALLVEAANGGLDDPKLSSMFRREMALSALRSVKDPQLATEYGRIYISQRESLNQRELAFLLCGLYLNATPDSAGLVQEMEKYCQEKGFALAAGVANDILVNKFKTRRPPLSKGMSLADLEQVMGGAGKDAGKITLDGQDSARLSWEGAVVTVKQGTVWSWEWR